jgi:hypothetical protein
MKRTLSIPQPTTEQLKKAPKQELKQLIFDEVPLSSLHKMGEIILDNGLTDYVPLACL